MVPWLSLNIVESISNYIVETYGLVVGAKVLPSLRPTQLLKAIIVLPRGTKSIIEDALLYPESSHTLLSFKDIRTNGYHIETKNENGLE
jgi:hypothetical protein